MTKPRLHVVTASTRPGRVGPAVTRWFADFARQRDLFDTHEVDLADFRLPVYDEPQHPVTGQYAHAHTRAWAQSVAAADAFVFVTPEYNYNPPPSLVNALNYVYREWNYKPCAFVSYGGISGGLRAVQVAKQLVTTLKMMPMVEGVMVPMVAQCLDPKGALVPNAQIEQAAGQMLDELLKWTGALARLRPEAARETVAVEPGRHESESLAT